MTLEGKWNLVIKTPFGKQKVSADLIKEAEAYTGTLTNEKGPVPITAAKLEGYEARFEGTVKTPMGDLKLSFHGVIQDQKIFGKCKTTFGTSDFSGERE
jgi:hypothetical protein